MGHAIPTLAVASTRRAADHRAVTERRLFRRCREGDEHARELLIERFVPLACRLARRYAWGREPIDDLTQVACLGLVKAIDRFDHERGVAFTTYAVPTIVGELKRYLRDSTWSLHVPQQLRQRVIEVTRAADELRASLGRTPKAEELAEAVGATVDYVAEAAEAASAYDTASLEGELQLNAEGADRALALGAEDERYDDVERGAVLEPALGALPVRERVILRLRFDFDMTQGEIAHTLGISQMHVSRLLRRSLGRLRAVAVARAA